MACVTSRGRRRDPSRVILLPEEVRCMLGLSSPPVLILAPCSGSCCGASGTGSCSGTTVFEPMAGKLERLDIVLRKGKKAGLLNVTSPSEAFGFH